MSDDWIAINLVGDIKIKNNIIDEYLIVPNFVNSDWIFFLNWNLRNDLLEKFFID
jgi:hypothetical protein